MKVVQPVPVTDAILVASSVAETDFPAWAVGSTYGLGDRVISTATHRIYESAVSGNVGQDPTGAGAASWIDVGPTNRWAMFDQAVGSLTSGPGSIAVSLHPGVVVDTIAVLDVTVSTVRVQVSVGGAIVHDETRNVTEGGRTATTLVFSDLPRDASADLTVTLTGTGTVSVGTLIIGRAFDLGETEAAPTISLTDYSRRETDEFGITTVVERSWAKRLSLRVKVETAAIDEVQRCIAALRATPAVWIGQDEPGILTAYGFFRDFSLDLQLPGVSYCSLTIESLPTSEVLDDATLDPAPAGQASTLKVIQSTPVTGSMLLSSSVVENDYSEWSAITNYSAGSRVIKAATHRIYESLIADNADNDPAGAGASSWIDIAPTNRWAMFDQALGSVTSDTGVITVTIAPGADIDAVALLDIDALAVRVEAPGYDQTKSTVVDGTKITSVSFLDLPGVTGDVTVTLTGAGTVSVGTLIIGRIAAMGLTEDTPSVGITDFSRKETDEFGLTIPVERAWAKRMTVRSLVDSGAVEDVLSRIAALRAKPSLWIGDEGFDSLTIYGFFRDFSIELGDNVSVFGLTVEGLTTAGAFSRNGTRWTDIVDNDPAHPKPEDGATVGAPEGTPVGGVPAEELVATMEENKQKVTDTLAQLGAAQLSIQELVDTYGYTASAAASADAALQFKGLAEQAKTDAAAAAQSSAGSAGASAQSATVASGFADDAGASATAAEGILLEAQSTADDVEAAATAVETARATVTDLAAQAQSNADLAAQYKSDTLGYKNTAETKAGEAVSAAADAAAAVTTATQKATVAGNSATTAIEQATIATDKAAAAQSSATLAASIAEDIDGDISDLTASVTQQAGAIASLEGKTAAYLETVTAAGSSRAAVRMVADGSSSGIELQADAIRLGSGNLPAMDVVNGNVHFYGNISVGSLPVQDYSNMIPDAGLTDINNWVTDGQPGWAFVTETNLGWSNSRAVRFSGTYTDVGSNYYSGLDTPLFPVTPGETYLVSCDIDPNSGATGTIAVSTAFFNSSGADAGGGSGNNYANAQSYAKQHISFFVTAPALATTAFFRIRRGSASGSGDTLSGTIYIGNITFRRAANTDMIPDDAITGPKLIANAVTSGKIAANQVNANHINVANLQAISATIGILRTASSGQRQEIRDNAIKVFDAANVLRMQSGNLSI